MKEKKRAENSTSRGHFHTTSAENMKDKKKTENSTSHGHLHTTSAENMKEKKKVEKSASHGHFHRVQKHVILGLIIACLAFFIFYIFQNMNSADVREVMHLKLDSIFGNEMLDAVFGILFGPNVSKPVMETYSTTDGKEINDNVKDGEPKATTKSIKQKYQNSDITNKLDNKIRSELDQADEILDKGKVTDAISLYDAILSRYPQSPRAAFGKASALNRMAELKQSNAVLEEAIGEFQKVLSLPDVPKALTIKAGKTCAERQSFRGWGQKAFKTLRQLVDLYPDEKELWNDLGVKCLLAHRIDDARQAFSHVLQVDPTDGFAMVHLGFIIKTTDKKYKEAIPYLQDGIATNQPGVIDGRFFFHLGDALFRVGQHNESYAVYKLGADKGLFMSMWQRSLYNVKGLTARPWWTKEQSGNIKFLKKLEENWKTIRDEGLENLDESKGVFKLEDEDLREEGDWRQFTLFAQGKKIEENCRRAPKTCALLESFQEATTCKRGQIKFSVMQPGVHVWPHCGPTNCRIRSHLGLVIPDGARIRIADETRTWKLGKFIVFDDSFEHEVWHDGSSVRLVLIVDMWHPDLNAHQKETLSPI